MQEGSKVCTKCGGDPKPLSDFSAVGGTGRYRGECKRCAVDRVGAYYRRMAVEQPERYKARNRHYTERKKVALNSDPVRAAEVRALRQQGYVEKRSKGGYVQMLQAQNGHAVSLKLLEIRMGMCEAWRWIMIMDRGKYGDCFVFDVTRTWEL